MELKTSQDLVNSKAENKANYKIGSMLKREERLSNLYETSTVLDKVKAFLPRLKEANELLLKTTSNTRTFDIEDVSDCGDRIIEMDVTLFDENDVCYKNLVDGNNQSTDDESSCDSDSESFELTEATMKLPSASKKARPEILITEISNNPHDT